MDEEKKNNILTIIGFILIFIIPIIIIKIFSISKTSDCLFLLVFYSILLTTIFFTIGKKAELNMLSNQVKYLVEEIIGIGKTINFNIDNNINLSNDTYNELKKEDKKIEDKNKDLIKKTIRILSIFSVITLFFSVILWFFVYKKDKKYTVKKYLQYIVLKNLIVLVFVFILQYLFYTIIISSYRPLDINNVILELINYIQNL